MAAMAFAGGPLTAQDAPDLPLWELGIGAVARGGADYPGASEYSFGGALFPYVSYRGRLLELGGDETVRLVPFSNDRFEIGVSFDSSSSVDSQDNSLRVDLPDLDALAEFGPEFTYRFAERPAIAGGGTGRFEVSLQTRGVFSVGSDIDHIGTLVRPALRYRQNGALKPGSRISASIGPIFASEGVHDFFYAVPGTYDARGGYLGTEIKVSLRYPLNDRARFIAGAGVTVLGGAANRDSPLFDDEVNASAFVGVTYSLFQSKRRTTRDR
jgi:hypothetical protein